MPGSSVGDLLVNLGIRTTQFTTGLSHAERAMEQAGTRMYFLGSRIAIGFGAPLAFAIAGVARFGMEFNAAMTESLAIMNDVTPEIRKGMEDVAKSMSESSTFSSAEAAKAYYGLASAGYTAQESMRALPVVTKFAQAGVMDLSKATEYLASAQVALGMRIQGDAIANMEEMRRVADVLTEANNRSLGTVEQFAQALTNKAGQSLRFFNKSVEEGVAALAMFHQQGILGRVAGTQLFMVLRDIGTKSINSGFAEAWKKAGIAVYDAGGQMRNLADIMDDFGKATDGMSDRGKRMLLTMLGIPSRSQAAVIALMGLGGQMRLLQTDLEAAGGATDTVANKQLVSFTNQLIILKNKGVNLLIDLFNGYADVLTGTVIPALEALLAAGRSLVDFFVGLPQPVKVAIGYFLALNVALGPMIMIIGSAQLAMRGWLSAVMLMSGGVGTLLTRIGSVIGMTTLFSTSAVAATTATNSAAASAILYGSKLSGVTVPAAGAAAGTMAGLSVAVLGTVAAIAALGVGIYMLTKNADPLKTALDRDTEAFNHQTDDLEKAVHWYDAYDKSSRMLTEGMATGTVYVLGTTKELNDAIRDMAEATGMTEEALQEELATSNKLLESLKQQIDYRRQLAQEKRNAEIADAGALEIERQKLLDRIADLTRGKGTTTEWTVGPGGETVAHEVPLVGDAANREAARLRQQASELKRRINEILKSGSVKGDVSLGLPKGAKPDVRLPTADPEPESDFDKAVKSLTEQGLGETGKSLKVVTAAFQNWTQKGLLESTSVLETLLPVVEKFDRYAIKMPPELEAWAQSHRHLTAEGRRYTEALDDISFITGGWKKAVDEINPALVEEVKNLKNAGASEEQIALAKGLTNTQVKAIMISQAAEISQKQKLQQLSAMVAQAEVSDTDDVLQSKLQANSSARAADILDAQEQIKRGRWSADMLTKIDEAYTIRAIAITKQTSQERLAILEQFDKDYARLVLAQGGDTLSARLFVLEAEETAVLASYTKRGQLTDEIEKKIRRNFALEKKTIEESIIDPLEVAARQAQTNFDDISTYGKASAYAMERAWSAAYDAMAAKEHYWIRSLMSDFGSLASVLGSLNSNSGHLFDGFAKGASTAVGGLVAGYAAGEQMNKTLAGMQSRLVYTGNGMLELKKGAIGTAQGVVQLTTGLLGAVAAMDAATQSASKAESAIGGAMSGAGSGAAIGGMWGAAIGAVVGLFVGLTSATDKQRKAFVALKTEASDTANKLMTSVGGMETLGLIMQQFSTGEVQSGATLVARAFQQIASATSETVLKQYVADLQQIVAKYEKAKLALDKYNLSVLDMGPAWQAANINARAQEMLESFGLLTDFLGVDVNKAIKNMGGDLSQLVIDAVLTGQKIPAALQPILEKLILMGGLTEEAARKLLGLADDTMPSLADITAAADRYGISLDALGPKVQQLRITEEAKQIVDDWKTLTLASDDFNTILGVLKDSAGVYTLAAGGMGEKVNDLVNKALKYGYTLPAGMQPIVEKMAEMGLLTDENGDKLTDLTKLTFAKDLTKMFEELIAKLNELIAKIGGVGGALNGIPTTPPWAGWPTPTYPDGTTVPPEPPPPQMARGGIVTGPTHALIGERGAEAVIPLDRLPGMLGTKELLPVTLMMPDGEVLLRQVVQVGRRKGWI